MLTKVNAMSATCKTWGLLLLVVLGPLGCARSIQPAAQFEVDDVKLVRQSLGSTEKAATTEVAAAEPTGWATLKGQFTLTGAPPARAALAVTKDQAICAPGGKPVLAEELVVNAQGGIKDVVIFLDSKEADKKANWVHPSYAATATADVTFDQKNCVFLSHVLAFRNTQKVILLNSDSMGHNTNIVGKGRANSVNVSLSGSGGTSDYLPGGDSPEPYSASCSVHPWMSSYMLSRANPYFAVTKEDGSFEIANVPAGVPLTFKVWQEKAKWLQTVTVNEKPAKWPKGKMNLTFKEGETIDLKVALDVAQVP